MGESLIVLSGSGQGTGQVHRYRTLKGCDRNDDNSALSEGRDGVTISSSAG